MIFGGAAMNTSRCALAEQVIWMTFVSKLVSALIIPEAGCTSSGTLLLSSGWTLVWCEFLDCYVLVERSARLELDGYDSVVWHVVLEACASSTQ